MRQFKNQRHSLSPRKARKMLHDKSAQGHPLTKKQRGLFGLIAGGRIPSRMAR